MKILVNGVEKTLPREGQPLTYAGVCVLAGKDPDLNPTVTWATPESAGTLVRGQLVNVSSGMVFNVALTGDA